MDMSDSELYDLNDDEMENLLECGFYAINKKYSGLSYKGVELEHDRSYSIGGSLIEYRLADPDKVRILFMGEDGVELDDALDRFLDDLESSLEVVEGGKIEINNKKRLRQSLYRLLK